MNIIYRNLASDDLPALKQFCDLNIGKDYFDIEELEDIHDKGQIGGVNCSFIALTEQKIVGARLTLAPGTWIGQYREKISSSLWNSPENKTAYFKSLFVGDQTQGQGVGSTLSKLSLDVVRQLGGEAVVCHSWLESPGNSSQRYLLKLGFQPVKEHPKFWSEIDYICTRCGNPPCQCTAVEMIFYLSKE